MHNNFAEKLILPENSLDYQHANVTGQPIRKSAMAFSEPDIKTISDKKVR